MTPYRAVLTALLLAAAAAAQSRDQREATVGMRAFVEQVVLPGSELVPAPSSTKAPIVVRVVETWPHGEHLRYDLEWVGFEPGSYDLTTFLVRKDGSSTDGLPAIEVAVTSTLAADVFEPSEIDPEASRPLGGYSALQIVVAVLWGIGLLLILFVGRKRRARAAPPAPKPTLADRLRPLVEEVASGRADDARKAELERLLLAFWRSRLDLGDEKAAHAVVAIRKHPEAGKLLRQVEAWLHMPEPPPSFDVGELLAPYRSVTAESFAPIVEGAVETQATGKAEAS
jgi:hypothetical protein